MSYVVRIRNNATGEVRSRTMDFNWFKTDPSGHQYNDLFWWTDGNFGCDCNRHLEFERAGGREESDELQDEAVCGHDAYTVLDATLPDGTVIPIDVADGT